MISRLVFVLSLLFSFSVLAQKNPKLPAPNEKASKTKMSRAIAWPDKKTPQAPQGFEVSRFADKLNKPRWIYVLPSGEILVAEMKGDILIYKDANKDGEFESKDIFLAKLKQPFGMLVLGDWFYVAQTDSLWRYPYKKGDGKITSSGEKILDLPQGGHWTRNIIANAKGTKIYVAVGSGSNIADDGMEAEARRANILEIDPDGKNEKVFASGLRNPVGMDWAPGTETLWTAVNERDGLGDDLVPDYMTSVKEGGFYGWPYSYFGQHLDPRVKGGDPKMIKKAIVPDMALGAHTASLGLTFYRQTQFPAKYQSGAFIGQHGSWNRSQFSGYKVVFVPFKGGKPSGPPQDFLTGFIADEARSQVYGRPVGVTVIPDGSLLVADDEAGIIWRVKAKK